MNRGKKEQYIIREMRKITEPLAYDIAKLLILKEYDLKQTNNGAYIHIDEINDETIDELYILMENK